MIFRPLAALLVAIAAWPATALQVVDASKPEAQGQRFPIVISQRELTRIALDPSTPGRVTDIINGDGELEIEKDAANGQFFIRPNARPDASGKFKPINAFIVTSNGNTHALLMEVRDVPLETVLVRDFTAGKAKAGETRASGDRGLPLDSALRRLVQAVLRGESGGEYEVQKANVALALFANTTFTLVESWRGFTLTGDRFVLANTGSADVRFVEQEFYRPGVYAVVIEQHVLQPGERTEVLVVRRSQQ